LKNAELQELTCGTFIAGSIWNEAQEGELVRGIATIVEYYTYDCKASPPCAVTNEEGVKKEGVSVSPEGPPALTTEKARRTGNTNLPWTGELIEREKGLRQLLIHDVKVWVDIPLDKAQGGPGEGEGCELLGGEEIPFEDQEGTTEKEAGDELAPKLVNGVKNGLSPSRWVFSGEKNSKKAEEEGKKVPETGRLISSEFGPLYWTGELLTAGARDLELLTAN
jgi:hypothetical protein